MDFGVSWSVAHGETVCGDAYALLEQEDRWLLCVADGLGHGPYAAEAARAACAAFVSEPHEHLEDYFPSLERHLAPLRGAAVSLLELQPSTGRARFAGIGNVELRAVTQRHFAPVVTPGIVGRKPRRPLLTEATLDAGDLLLLCTDGVHSRADPTPFAKMSAEVVVQRLLFTWAKRHDDALCAALRVPARRAR